jgi:hypothetical protein
MASPPGSVYSVASSIITSQTFSSMWICTLLVSSIFVTIARKFSNLKEVLMFMSLQSTGMSTRDLKPAFNDNVQHLNINDSIFMIVIIKD